MEQEPLLFEAKLEQLKESLKASLDEVCDADVTRLDTGQLVRIEEVLVVAHEAAKEAVSLRRKRGRRPRKGAPPEAEVSLSTAVGTHRLFTDAEGTTWDVFAVFPPSQGKGLARLPGPFQQGWLCFDAAIEKRRLSPIPKGWETVSDDELTHLRDQATPVPPRTTPPEQHGGVQ